MCLGCSKWLITSARRLRVRRERGRGGREGSVGGEWECVADARRLRGRMGMCLGCSKWLITIVPGGKEGSVGGESGKWAWGRE